MVNFYKVEGQVQIVGPDGVVETKNTVAIVDVELGYVRGHGSIMLPPTALGVGDVSDREPPGFGEIHSNWRKIGDVYVKLK